jgi:hypothetical protein
MEDAIYVGDAISVILKQIEKGEVKPFLLKSNIKNQWNKINGILQERETIERNCPIVSIKQGVISLPVNSIPIEEGIELQKKHLATLGII